MTPPQAKAAALLASPDDIEAQFYEALQQGDIDKMMAVWSDDDDAVCVHPGHGRVVGPRAIRASFEAIFANGSVPVQPEGAHRFVTTGTAVHSVIERVDIRTAEGLQTAWTTVTNVYVKTTQGWRMVAHHASPGTAHELLEVHETSTTLH